MIPENLINLDIDRWLLEDVPYSDLTSSFLIDKPVNGYIFSKSQGTVAGIYVAEKIFNRCGVTTEIIVQDGTHIDTKTRVLEIHGLASKILLAERISLNILSHMSGIATQTWDLVKLLRENNSEARVAATRKTLPGLRKYQKWAVEIGGGDTHRMSLSDMVLIKENHISSASSIKELLQRVKNTLSFSKKIEIEVTNNEQAKEAAEFGVDIIMLDNYKPNEVSKAVSIIKEINANVLVEVSGNITEKNIVQYAQSGVDIVSLGKLTHSVKAMDYSLLIKD